MKKKLSEFLADIKGLRASWLAAKNAKKPEAEVKAALTTYQEAQAQYDIFVEGGKKDDDEVEIKAADNVIELGELGDMIAEKVKSATDARFGDLAKNQLTEAAVKKIVQDAIKSTTKTEEDLSDDEIQTVVDSAVDKAFKSIKLPSKFRRNPEDAERGGAAEGGTETDPNAKLFSEAERKSFGLVEMPSSLTKGNLPLHMKQLVNCLLRKPQDQDIPESMLKKGKALDDAFFLKLQIDGVKALTSTGTGTGAEWVPRNLSAELYRRLYLASQVAQSMMAREIQMPTQPYDLPFSTTRPTFYLNSVQNREAKASTPGSSKPSLSAQKLIALVQYSYEANEDAIIPILPLIEQLLGEAAAAAYESALINGDVTATHQDSDVTDNDDTRKAWNGFRKLAIAAGLTLDMSTGGITRANILALKKVLRKWGVMPSDLMFICPPRTHSDFMGIDDVVTLYAHGPGATHLVGQLPSYYGIDITVSEQAREDLNASGVFDNTTTTKGGLLLVNKAQFATGVRREFTIEVDKNIKSQTNDIVASFRKAFTPLDAPSSTIRTVAYGINYNI